MSLPVVIVNPESAGGTTRKAWPSIASDLRSHFGPFEVRFTDAAGAAVSIATDVARQGAKFIIACGGDGTVSEVANGILNSGKDAELGIIPSGTGGDFRRTLEIPNHVREAAKILRSSVTRTIDVGRVTFVNHNGDETVRYFLGVASCGMSTRVIERVKENTSGSSSWLGGRLSFGSSMMKTAINFAAIQVVVQLDDAPERKLSVANLCIANARYFGGGMKIAPDAKLTDGKFDVVSIGDLGTVRLITSAPRVYLGSHMSMDEVNHALAKKVLVRPATKDAEVPLEIDGELLGLLPATFQIIPSGLRVRSGA